MISYTELKKGTIILLNNDPYEVVDTKFVRMQQRKAVVQSKLKNLKSGKVIDKSWQASENIEEADFQKQEITFIYSHKGEFWFQEKGNPQNRMMVPEDAIGDNANFLKPQTDVTAYILEGEIIKIVPPIKVEVEVTEAPPAVKGNTAQGGDKMVTVETGAKVTVPLFINQGDIIIIIGVLRAYNQEIYLLPEIIKKQDPRYLLIRNLEIEKENKKHSPPPKEQVRALREELMDLIKESENREGIEVEEIILKLKSQPKIINEEIKKLLEEGIIYEPKPGRLRYLG